jgi:hypothetical protein
VALFTILARYFNNFILNVVTKCKKNSYWIENLTYNCKNWGFGLVSILHCVSIRVDRWRSIVGTHKKLAGKFRNIQ